ncbi:MAG: 30S ribosomal protein S19 [archaeon]
MAAEIVDYKPAEYLFRGKTLDELSKLTVREFAKYLKARQKRNLLRNFGETEKFLTRIEKKKKKGKQIRTHSRALVIVPAMVGLIINVHNGQEFKPIRILPEMMGHRLGEFSLTRKKVEHSAPGIGATKSSAALSVK